LLDAVIEYARAHNWKRLWLNHGPTTNTDALRMYQRAGWDWVGWYRNAVQDARALKPELPTTGAHEIPIRHEIELDTRSDAPIGATLLGDDRRAARRCERGRST